MNIKKRTILIMTIISLFFVWFFLNNSFVTISPGNFRDGSTLTLTKNGGQSKEIKPGWRIISKGGYTLEFSSDNKRTLRTFEARPLQRQTLAIDLKPQQKLYKVATAASPCLFGNLQTIKSGEVLSYDCSSILTMAKNSYKGRIIAQSLVGDHVENTAGMLPYKNGLVGIGTEEESPDNLSIVYKEGLKSQARSIAEWTSSNDPFKFDVYVDDQTLLILDIEAKKLLSFTNIASDPTIRQLVVPEDRWSSLVTMKTSGDNLYLLSTKGEEQTDSASEGNLIVFSKDQNTPQKIINVDRHAESLQEYLVIDDVIVSLSLDRNFSAFRLKDDSLEQIGSLTEVLDIARPQGRDLFILRSDGAVYSYDQKNSSFYQVFSSANIKISSLASLGDNLVLNGYSDKFRDPPVNFSFLLENEPLGDEARLEDYLPYSPKDLPIIGIDYLGNQIRVTLSLRSLGVDKKTGEMSYDQREFNSARGKVLERLQADGFSPNKYTITFEAG